MSFNLFTSIPNQMDWKLQVSGFPRKGWFLSPKKGLTYTTQAKAIYSYSFNCHILTFSSSISYFNGFSPPQVVSQLSQLYLWSSPSFPTDFKCHLYCILNCTYFILFWSMYFVPLICLSVLVLALHCFNYNSFIMYFNC